MSRIRQKERRAILDSLRAGVVPKIGQHHIQVGRHQEVKALLSDIENVADGGSAVRFVIGEYGSGKTFFLGLIQSIALEKKLVTTSADLTPDRRIQATGGQARALYSELMRNIATRAKPEGGALASIAERFISDSLKRARESGAQVETVIQERLAHLTEMTGGYDFAHVIEAYWHGHDSGNETLKQAAVRWLRGEYSTKTEARQALGVRTIIDDANIYDSLKLMARFVRLSGFGGLLVTLDELVNLYKLSSTQARNTNYEQILRILNDCLQGSAEGFGIVFGGTPDFLMDPRRGLYSYEALSSRLAENRFAQNGLIDFSGPVLRLANLSQEDLYLLLTKIQHVASAGDEDQILVPDEALRAFLDHCHKTIGSAYFKTPRNSIKEFVSLLSVLAQNPEQDWQSLIGTVQIAPDTGEDEIKPLDDESVVPNTGGASVLTSSDSDDDDDEMTSFRL
ncbi:MAG: ATP-binding protein [Halomonadaceae bacterium]|nr:MAG: ATP-binding protein [Halomonadaceae bacterium]